MVRLSKTLKMHSILLVLHGSLKTIFVEIWFIHSEMHTFYCPGGGIMENIFTRVTCTHVKM